MIIENRIKKIYQSCDALPFNKKSKIVIMSDCHRGQGNSGDNFLQNQSLFFAALNHYYEHEFIYIELGDGDELWENRKMDPIVQVHTDAFWLLSQFYNEDRFVMIYGNHDMIKKKIKFCKSSLATYLDEASGKRKPLFPCISMKEGLILKNTDSKNNVFLIHGHQGEFINDICWRLGRFLVRYFWRPLELVGFTDPTGAGRTHERKKKIEAKLSDYAAKEKTILVAGHTHRPYFSKPGDGFYFNDGSCVHPRCITALEIENNQISLVKWSVRTRENRNLYVAREILELPVSLDAYL